MAAELTRRGLFRGLAGGAKTEADRQSASVAQIGESCVEAKGVSCRRCGEACDADAIHFKPIGGGRNTAVLADTLCNGCGACLSVCPVNAITLISLDRKALISGLADLRRPA